MKKIKALILPLLISVIVFIISCCGVNAQPAIPVKHTVKAHSHKYSEVAEYTYCLQGDTVYNCQIYSGQKIALADVDFDAKEIVKSETLEEGTNNNVYVITLNLKKGKKSYSCGCAMGELTGDVRSANKAVKIVECSEALAEFEFTYLNRMSLEQQLAQMPADTNTQKSLVVDDSKSAIDKILEEDSIKNSTKNILNKVVDANRIINPDPSSAKKVIPPATNRSFEAHLAALIDGLKDDYKSMKGARVPDANQFGATVSLDGAVTTRVNYGAFNHVSLIADYGDYSTMEEALPVYQKISALVENSKRMPALMVKQDEQTSEIGRTNSWLPFGEMPDDLKGFNIIVELVKSIKYDKKTLASKDVYFVQLKLDK